MGYESWKHTKISPSSIELDPKNPRLPNLPEGANQPDVRSNLLASCKVREMAKSISTSGFYPDQTVVVIRKPNKNSRFIAIEGNRRVCACQLLLKPNLAPAEHSRYIERLSVQGESYKASFEKIPVVIAPDRLAAIRLVVSRHLNQAPVISWSLYAQGQFAINAFNDGKTMEQVINETGLSSSDIRKAVQDARIIDLFMGLKWDEGEKEIIYDSVDDFPVGVLRRILTSSVTKEKFGNIYFDDSGWLNFEWDQEIIESVLKRFMYDSLPALTGSSKKAVLTSRTINDKEDVKRYYKEDFILDVKNVGNSNAVSAKDLIEHVDRPSSNNDSKGKNEGELGAKKPSRPKKKVNPRALPANLEINIKNDKAGRILQELQIIEPQKYPYATALLLRSLLEVSLIARMKHVDVWKDFMIQHQKGSGIPPLETIVKFAGSCSKTVPDQSLRNSMSNQHTVPRKLLNFVTHNDQHVFTSTDAKDAAEKMTPLFRALLEAKY
ncbi:ParB/RepB/Spo0J family partition protein [Kushneria sp. AK178]